VTKRLLRVSYDHNADVLYLSIRQAPAARGIEDREGIVWRYDNNDKLIGATILDYHEHWARKFRQLVGDLSEKFDIPIEEIERAIGGQ
jgi:uncharacterized protein YuzE